MRLVNSYFRLARPKQWTKNGFVLAGVVFAHQALLASSVASTLLAFVAFCAKTTPASTNPFLVHCLGRTSRR